ncbi:hypothetical protein DSM112329_04034 [Paraconexibacter sp. AEG42_29]|uniref:AttH domain-containing protein n=1 Tax=Paraconexibacter sp. AEG42_29 TaxID=2997339 RepID=A0AAU7AZR9_9ACTN
MLNPVQDDWLAAEGWQAAGDDPQWSDSFYFGGGDAVRRTAFYTRIGRRPNEGTVDAAIGIWLADGRFALAFTRAEAGPADGPVAGGGLAFDPLLPGLVWRLRVAADARVYTRAEDLGVPGAPFERLPLGGELTFTGWTPPLHFDSGLTAQVAARHYEQPGSLAGVLTVGDTRLPLAGAGMRDHSWGVRDWQGVPYWRWLGMLVDPDTFVLLNTVGTADGGETAGGYLMQDGVLAPLVRARVDGDQLGFTAVATDDRGRGVTLTGGAIAVAPLRQRRDGRLTLVNEGLTELQWGTRSGLAISEWLVQTDA